MILILRANDEGLESHFIVFNAPSEQREEVIDWPKSAIMNTA
jgi:hypothetical protein